MKMHGNFEDAIKDTTRKMLQLAQKVHTERWQGVTISQKPEMAMFEVFNHSMSVPMSSESLDFYRESIKPNIPWADDHFQERVSGWPLNPGKEWANWPYNTSADKFREGDKFNHSYMERYWPKVAGKMKGPVVELPNSAEMNWYENQCKPNHGIYHNYGDLNDMVRQLAHEPDTRQAYLPVFFPEDTGAVHKGRVPCSLGYHFLMRNGFLHINYYLRSCDYTRHFRDDLYLTVRLLLWVLIECRKLYPKQWNGVKPGVFTIHITSLHCFKNDMKILIEDYKTSCA